MITIPWKFRRQRPERNGSVVVQVSELQLGPLRHVPRFLIDSLALRREVLQTNGAVGISIRANPLRRDFWTLSAWEDEQSLRQFTRSKAHRKVMVRYGPHMRGSHFHHWFATEAEALPPRWEQSLRILEEDKQSD